MRKKSTWSLGYVVFYLATTGLALMVAPQESLRLLGATGSYDSIFVRNGGIFMVALSMIVFQILRHQVEVLVQTTIFVRVFFVMSFFWLWWLSKDPLFLVIISVVSLGLAMTTTFFLLERRKSTKR